MATYQLIAIIVFLTSVFAYINDRFIKWPPTIGIMALSLISSILLASFGPLVPQLSARAVSAVYSIDFEKVLMKIMLGFLLFAGAIHIDYHKLKKEMVPVLVLATIGTFISTFLVSIATFYLFQLFQVGMPYIYCLLFGALISPTDPIAVMGILKQAGIPASLELKIAGESLFNDGVAVVVFLTILEVATNGAANLSATSVGLLFLREAVGGLVFGGLMGYTGFLVLRSIDNYRVEVLITLAIVMCGYAFADYIHVSAPLAMVVVGIFLGSVDVKETFSAVTREYLAKFWDLIDEIFNAILFLLVGLEMLVIRPDTTVMIIGIILIFLVLGARWVSVFFPVLLMRYKIKFEKNAVTILTWGGLRGGLSVAMALSLPKSMHREEFILITYLIVIFSIIVQGLSIGKLAERLGKKAD